MNVVDDCLKRSDFLARVSVDKCEKFADSVETRHDGVHSPMPRFASLFALSQSFFLFFHSLPPPRQTSCHGWLTTYYTFPFRSVANLHLLKEKKNDKILMFLLGVIRFRRDVLRSDRASWILVGHAKKREKTVIANNDYALAA